MRDNLIYDVFMLHFYVLPRGDVDIFHYEHALHRLQHP